jgi:hypothetical protein
MSGPLTQIAERRRRAMSAAAIVLTCTLCLSSGRSGYGQTNDHFYRSWRWSTTPASTRAVGLAGAYAALADDSGTAFLNPAGIASLAKSEFSVSLLAGQPGTVGLDRLAAWTGLAAGSGAVRLSKKTALACYFVRPRAGRMELSPARLPDGSADAGYLDATITDVGVVVARRVAERLSIGVRVTATHLKLQGLQTHIDARDHLDLETGSAAGDTRVTASLGLLYEAGSTGRFRLGLVVQPGASYTVERTASRPSLGGIDQGSLYELRAPGLVAVGAVVRINRHAQVSSQLDYVRYSEIHAFVRPGGATTGGYAISDAVEPRFGGELAYLLGDVSLQFRAGAYLQAPGSFAYHGPDVNEAAVFRGSKRRVISGAGVSLTVRGGLTVDVGGAFGGDRSEVAAGARFRF